MRWIADILIAFTLLIVGVAACDSDPEPLPVLNKRVEIEGQMRPQRIPEFTFINQDSQLVTRETFAGKAYVADFFFTSCPTICPIMTRNMLKIYRQFEEEDRLLLLSHTIDPGRDSVGQLHHYAENIGVSSGKWHFVTGQKDSLYAIADDYFNVVVEDPTLPGGYDHSGRLVLIDTAGHIRAYCNGTNDEEVQQFIKDIQRLLHEMENSEPAGS
ncbi:MAG TPA: SCO family protein [Phaeodactylibacter sp.]|nr:SCO family protein [Phaeodactylibacter sp.]